MYRIFKHPDGTFHCEGKIQDGTERWTEATLEGAIRSMRKHALVLNGVKITKRDIEFFEPVQAVEWKRCRG